MSVCVLAVSKSHEFLLKVRRLSSFFSTTTPTPSRVVFFPRRRKGFDFDDEHTTEYEMEPFQYYFLLFFALGIYAPDGKFKNNDAVIYNALTSPKQHMRSQYRHWH